MSWFTRLWKDDASDEREYDGSFARTGAGAPPPHLRDKNLSHSGQGAQASQNASQPADGVGLGVEPYDQDTTSQ